MAVLLLSAFLLLVPGYHFHLLSNLALSQFHALRCQHSDPVRVLTCYVERYAVFGGDLTLKLMGRIPAKDVSKVRVNLFLTVQLPRRARGVVAIDDTYPSIACVE